MHSCGFPQEGPDAGPGSAAPLFTAASLAQSRCSAVPASGPQPDRLSPQSQSFSQGYGSVLPTSLTYIGLSTRGCSPWRPAADVAPPRENYPARSGFSPANPPPRDQPGQQETTSLPSGFSAPFPEGVIVRASRQPGEAHGAWTGQRVEPGAPYSRGTPKSTRPVPRTTFGAGAATKSTRGGILSWLFSAGRSKNLRREAHGKCTAVAFHRKVPTLVRARPHRFLRRRASPSPGAVPFLLLDPSPTGSALRANPFPKVTDPFCRLPLPTLVYRLEAVHLGDLLRMWNRFGPPPEFPLASSCPGIVHHLSGANVCALAPPRRRVSAWDGPLLRPLSDPCAVRDRNAAH
ncbi:hypothetical protein HPB52_017431 [Rhipicephalus sanguineus]|uniref:Uncharacterized protein n=1 Tax=Rhipicephalus sanguineus TaxID=34632 RepID=A0A9D4Q1I6_RHISA|nr:hypothetical protein HPB52_017430 [Rhipicephalus sanguineus]KAH7962679.1 hypothetical protein HPB52_017431 [Rhipicephalus sanguineus]